MAGGSGLLGGGSNRRAGVTLVVAGPRPDLPGGHRTIERSHSGAHHHFVTRDVLNFPVGPANDRREARPT